VEIDLAGLEGFERHLPVAEIFVAEFIEIVVGMPIK
jgi:hypothetical protein